MRGINDTVGERSVGESHSYSDYLGAFVPVSDKISYSSPFPLSAPNTMAVPPKELRYRYFDHSDELYLKSGVDEAARMRELLVECGVQQDAKILDFGCASGRILAHLCAHYPNVTGVDIDSRCVEWILAHLPRTIKAAPVTSFASLPLEDRSFNVIIARSVFTHIRDRALMTLMELHRILKPGGIALVSISDDFTWKQYRDGPSWFDKGSYFDLIGLSPEVMQSNENIPGDYFVHGVGYYSMIFYRRSYIQEVWGRFFDVLNITPLYPAYTPQSVVIMRKRVD